MKLHESFEWGEDKAETNDNKHQVTFEDAAYVLADEEGDVYHVEEFDEEHSDEEDRYRTTASHPDDRSIVLRIAWKDVSSKLGNVTRLISARAATPKEVAKYVEEINAR